MKKRIRPLLTAGTSSLLLIFVSLCLLTFSVLSLSSSRADYQLSKKIADRTELYYQAANCANRKLSEIEKTLVSLLKENQTEEAYFSALAHSFSDFDTEKQTLSFSVPIQDGQELSVILQIFFPTMDDGIFYSIIQWKTINTTDWTPDTRQHVYVQPTP